MTEGMVPTVPLWEAKLPYSNMLHDYLQISNYICGFDQDNWFQGAGGGAGSFLKK
jgi:hypothetical protein